jgi:hypothetical protein
MVKVAAVGGYQPKVALVEDEQGKLALDGAERSGDIWRPVPVEPPESTIHALNEALSKLEPTPSALQQLLNEKLS